MTEATLSGSDRSLQEAFDVALLDLDGVVYRGAHGVPHAAQAVDSAREGGMRTMFVTNNAARSPQTVARHLTDLAIPTGPEEVTTAAQAAAALVASEADADTRVLVIGGDGLREAVLAEGLDVVETAADAPTIVVQGFAPTLGWPDLAEAVYAISAGADFVASNIDATLPTERGMAPGNGSLVAAVVHATGVQPRSTGKPQPEIFHQAAERSGARQPLVVGDRLNTDLAGARAAGYPGLHVLTGVDGIDEVLRARPGERPEFLARDLRGLAESHPQPFRDGELWRCRDASVSIREGQVVLHRDGAELLLGETSVRMDEFRAAAAAAWDASDTAGVDTVLSTPDQPAQLASD
ncbi:HAD-IIA family hydrolase [Ruania alba]|uniref:Haloacid Dehalogenase Superfamily Class (Subfamily) IIA/haloacid dehalogenase superfamily, subfamily IA, variant 1 with third motif having Dx(3-4)D or Dx(3-4)E n=1 Tax=Ruania alba TaxID=648782 RepID=A0A1H5EH76_9MICO|nr:HAD-IIA family hydrolase [Ruania alba]SED90334.1 Haloacid Dehalogenase Superfamily Class (subfamily) IIA/haloacid dehalogenase superfamily, subfamily IA, variant 1 with third motif having Dx(3-4)D or Dx(3-4)E [Ruania alba]